MSLHSRYGHFENPAESSSQEERCSRERFGMKPLSLTELLPSVFAQIVGYIIFQFDEETLKKMKFDPDRDDTTNIILAHASNFDRFAKMHAEHVETLFCLVKNKCTPKSPLQQAHAMLRKHQEIKVEYHTVDSYRVSIGPTQIFYFQSQQTELLTICHQIYWLTRYITTVVGKRGEALPENVTYADALKGCGCDNRDPMYVSLSMALQSTLKWVE